VVSAKFHWSVARLIVLVAEKIRNERKLNRVALSGGVFQNLLLLKQTTEMLRASDFQVFTHTRVPANDGGISLGQAAVANAQMKLGRA
jgi:hydrogenase maturation protein HypF